MAKASAEDQLAAVQAVRSAAGEEAPEALAARLRPFLKQQNNLVVARAADVAADLDLRALLDDLLAAFRRFLDAEAKKDPQCWAKNSLSKALHRLGCDDADVFLAGLRTRQLEGTWGGQSDVAGTLRANCAHALIDCHQVPHRQLLLHLLEIVADPDRSVRGEALRAIALAGGESAGLLLRLRALTASDGEDASVLGHCYAGLLSLEGASAVPFVARFLSGHDERAAEAAVALGETRTPEALAALLACLRPARSEPEVGGRAATSARARLGLMDPWFAGALLSAIALTRQPEAIATLLRLVADESSHAEAAIEALATANYGPDVREQLAAVLAKLGNDRLRRCFQRQFPG